MQQKTIELTLAKLTLSMKLTSYNKLEVRSRVHDLVFLLFVKWSRTQSVVLSLFHDLTFLLR